MVLGSEPLSEEAERQRIEFLRRLESVSKPPSLPPRPAHLSERYRARVQQNELNYSGSVLPAEESNLYKNEKTLDPVEFASKQRELSRVTNLYKTYVPQTVVFGEKGSKNGGLYFPKTGNATYSGVSFVENISFDVFLLFRVFHLKWTQVMILNLPHVYVTKFSIQKKAIPVCASIQRKMSHTVCKIRLYSKLLF